VLSAWVTFGGQHELDPEPGEQGRGAAGYGQAGVATFVPPSSAYGPPGGVQVSPRAFQNSEPPSGDHGLALAPVTSRAAQVTQPIVTHSAGMEKNRSLLYTGLGVGAVAVLCILIYVFLAKTEPGVVQITTHPADAQVMFDGKPAGAASPFVVTGVAPNENHLIEVRKQGYTSWSQEVQVQPGQTLQLPVGLELTQGGEIAAATGGFSLETLPPGARVLLDGQELGGVTPLRVGNLVPRRYEVKVRLNGYRETTLSVDVRSGIDQSLAQTILEAQQFRVRVTSEPPNAEAVVTRGEERRPLGKTPIDVTLENNGTPWELEVSKKGFETHTETLTSQSGSSELAVRAVLMKGEGQERPQPDVEQPVYRAPKPTGEARPRVAGVGGNGTLRVNSRPWSQVFVDGKMIGNTPQMNLALSAGDHRITLVNPEFRLRKNLTITIKPGQVTTQIVTLQ